MLSLLAAAVFAQSPSTPPAKLKKAERACRDIEKPTGSHIRAGTICKTAEQWRIEDEARGVRPLTLQVKTEESGRAPQ